MNQYNPDIDENQDELIKIESRMTPVRLCEFDIVGSSCFGATAASTMIFCFIGSIILFLILSEGML